MLRTAVLLLIILFLFSFSHLNSGKEYVFPELRYFPEMPVSRDNPVTEAGAELGRYLFYDPILSADSNISCGSCHKQEYAFSDAPNAFSKGFDNRILSRNTLPLFNLAWYPSLFWDGRASSVEEQVFHPVRDTSEMNLLWPEAIARLNRSKFYRSKFKAAFNTDNIDSILIARAIAQFERTLISYRSRYDSVLQGLTYLTAEERDGLVLMNDMTKGDCLHCHTTDADPLGTTLTFSNNGLDAATDPMQYRDAGRGKITGNMKEYGSFKIPSLRNIALTAPYMHDGRFKTLEEVIDFYSEGVYAGVNIDSKMGLAHQHGVHLTPQEKKNIITFLNTLTDSAFVKDPQYRNPFK
jgi:cytochrome c peroxidase